MDRFFFECLFTKKENYKNMNTIECEVLKRISQTPGATQRQLSEHCDISVGKINQVVKTLLQKNLISRNNFLTEKGEKLINKFSPERAVILAAGFGMRMVPIGAKKSKGLLVVKKQRLVERIIKQLHEKNINDITIVVGFMKEKYEFLIDKYHVNLVVNSDYGEKNNLFSLLKAKDKLSNCYIVPCDLYSNENPFSGVELNSWYLLSSETQLGSTMTQNKQKNLVHLSKSEIGKKPVGLAYINQSFSLELSRRLILASKKEISSQDFWESCLFADDNHTISAKIDFSQNTTEINNYEDLRLFDPQSPDLENKPLKIIEKCLNVSQSEIQNIHVLKKGMTNRSFKFTCCGKKYIMRIPGEGTEQLINRKNEANIYKILKGTNLTDEVKYINPDDGYKLTEFIEGARNCDSLNTEDVKKCMYTLRSFHDLNLKVDQQFNLVEQIKFYEKLLPDGKSMFPDYAETKKNVEKLIKYVDVLPKNLKLCHIDANSDNFIFYSNDRGVEQLRLIDWEYAGMQDPDLDIAMFAIYALYDRKQVDQLIDFYYFDGCEEQTRTKIYCYMAISGLLWSNWCEYKSSLGVEFGKYSLWQYHYAKEYYRVVADRIK